MVSPRSTGLPLVRRASASGGCDDAVGPAGLDPKFGVHLPGHFTADQVNTLRLDAYFGPDASSRLDAVMRRVLRDARPA
jgi:hypothetical protein